MPTSARSWASALPSSGSGLPSIVMVPESIGLEPVDRAAQRRLAGAGRADDDDDLALADGEVDVLEHVQVAEVLVDALQDDQGLGHAGNLATTALVAALRCSAESTR